jgi:hypothetical protein
MVSAAAGAGRETPLRHFDEEDRMNLRFLAALGAVVASAGCDFATGPGADGRVIGIIEWQAAITGAAANDDVVITAPDTVHAGVPFQATITTIGLSGCWSADGASIKAAPRLVTITPYDRVANGTPEQPTYCTAALVGLDRHLDIVFSDPGTATLRVNGRIVIDGDLEDARPHVVEKQIIVR